LKISFPFKFKTVAKIIINSQFGNFILSSVFRLPWLLTLVSLGQFYSERREQGAKSREQGAKSRLRSPATKSRSAGEQGAGSREQGAESREQSEEQRV
jgi:hypothetical protein